jgi:transcription elongation factor Elf1
MPSNELKCPHCGSSDVSLASLFPSYSALADLNDDAVRQCPQCGNSYEVARTVSVSFETHCEVGANY